MTVQESTRSLFDEPAGRFPLRPDIVVRRRDGAVFVLDTKWKTPALSGADMGVAREDVYQMFAYQKRYAAKRALLLYPWTEGAPAGDALRFRAADGTDIGAFFIDLFHARASLDALAALLEE